MSAIITVENLSKRYHLGQIGATTLRESAERFVNRVRLRKTLDHRLQTLDSRKKAESSPSSSLMSIVNSPTSSSPSLKSSSDDTSELWALKDVSFEVKPGEVLGIIGRNGAGKSTLLKVLSRITEPTSGRAIIRGRVASLLEVGTGFHPELTGRENIFLNGAILGMKKVEIAQKFDEIVAFSEVERFIDTPVKRYSSGMYVRLAFAVAAHLEPEILIIDEVLAVGDASFQKKCLGKMGDVAKHGRTVLFVSHNMGAILGLCNRTLWINRGAISFDGDSKTAVERYLAETNETGLQTNLGDVGDFLLDRVALRNAKGEATSNFQPGEDIIIDIQYFARKPIPKPHFWIAIESQFGSLFAANMLMDGLRPDFVEGKGGVRCVFKNARLLPQSYSVSVGVRDEEGMQNLTPTVASAAMFNIVGNALDYRMPGEVADRLLGSSSPMLVPYEWQFADGQTLVPEWCRHL